MNWRWSAGVGQVGRVVQADSGAFEWQSVFRDHEGSEYPLSGVNLVPHEGSGQRQVHVYYDPARLSAVPGQPVPGTRGESRG